MPQPPNVHARGDRRLWISVYRWTVYLSVYPYIALSVSV